ncbi:MAG: GvpL/GvpF family gas vesicle protein, partial [Deltaproteobacteria bacterium]
MAYLVYGVVKEPAVAGSSLTGMKGQPVSFVAGHGLCAAVSELDVEEGAPPVSELLVYSKVVEDLHRLQAVVPMRYGCFINGIQAIRNVLQEKQRPYETLLAELEGHVEMGIRILLGDTLRQGVPLERPPRQAHDDRNPVRPEPCRRVSRSSGQAYLALRKVHY